MGLRDWVSEKGVRDRWVLLSRCLLQWGSETGSRRRRAQPELVRWKPA